MSRKFFRMQFIACASVVVLLVNPLTASAQDEQAGRERGSIAFGVFITNRDSSARLDSDTGTGTDIGLEGDLGLKKSMSVARLNGHLWFAPRQRFDVAYFDLSRNASRRIDRDIEFGDQIFDIDTVINSTVDLSIIKSDYTFAPVNLDRGFFGITAGLYVAATKFSLSEATLGKAESENLTAPLPVIGVRGDYEITDRISIGGALQWFGIDTGDTSGRLRDLYVGADYRFGRRMAVGLAYNDVSLNIRSADTGGFSGALDWGYDGWLLYTKADFGR